jgi:4'-phosphopantetheinyl transferase
VVTSSTRSLLDPRVEVDAPMTSVPARLGPDDVHIFVAVCPGETTSLAAQRALLSPGERSRCDGLRLESARAQFIASRALLRTALALDRAVSPDELAFAVDARGRPVVERPAGLSHLGLSLSHTDGIVACAVAWRRAIGVDVERASRPIEAEAIARRFFAPSERAALLEVPPARRLERFWQQWTLKEAYVKALGLGLSQPFTGFAIVQDRMEHRLASPTGARDAWTDAGDWTFRSVAVAGSHWLAGCAEVTGGRARLTIQPPPPRCGLAPVSVAAVSLDS